jgi:hypothetical protein
MRGPHRHPRDETYGINGSHGDVEKIGKMVVSWDLTNKNGDFNGIYPLVNIQKAIENCHL